LKKKIDNRLIVLAGGLGTRLRNVVSDVPKPMAPINGVPFLEYLLQYWVGQNIQEIILSVGYKSDIVKNYFGNFFCGIPLKYVCENEPLGTGGAVKSCLSAINDDIQNTLIVNGDTWFEVNLSSFIAATNPTIHPVKIALKKIDGNYRYDGVGLDCLGNIERFGIKNTKETLINGGCYWVDPNFLSNYLKRYSGKFSFENDVLTRLAEEKLLYGYVQNGHFCDIGIPEDYQKIGSIIVR